MDINCWIRTSFIILFLTTLSIPVAGHADIYAGQIDTNFGTGGIVDVHIPLNHNDERHDREDVRVFDVKQDVNGNFFITGIVAHGNRGGPLWSWNTAYLAKLTPMGGLDATFGNGGVVYLQEHDANQGEHPRMAIQSNGKIIVAYGVSGENNGLGFMRLARYNSNGQRDETFLGEEALSDSIWQSLEDSPRNGQLVISRIDDILALNDDKVAILTDGRIFQLNENGSLDNAFGEGGYAFLNMDASSDGRIIPFEANGVGKILVAYPNLRWDEPGRLDIRQYFSNGHIDPEFQPGENPVQLALNVNGSPVRLLRLFVQPSNGTNKILTLGLIHEDNPRNQDCVVARFTMDGILDPTFNNNGYTVLERPDGPESCEDLILEDQRLIVIGSSPSAGIILFGLNQNGQVDDFFRGHRMSMPRIRSFTWGYDAFVKNYENVPYIILIGGDYNGTRPGTASVIRYHLREQDDGPGNFAVEPPANAAQNRNSGHSYNTLGKSKPKKSPSGKDEKQDSKKKNTGNVLRRLGQ